MICIFRVSPQIHNISLSYERSLKYVKTGHIIMHNSGKTKSIFEFTRYLPNYHSWVLMEGFFYFYLKYYNIIYYIYILDLCLLILRVKILLQRCLSCWYLIFMSVIFSSSSITQFNKAKTFYRLIYIMILYNSPEIHSKCEGEGSTSFLGIFYRTFPYYIIINQ